VQSHDILYTEIVRMEPLGRGEIELETGGVERAAIEVCGTGAWRSRGDEGTL
jgi:hypothetical protein